MIRRGMQLTFALVAVAFLAPAVAAAQDAEKIVNEAYEQYKKRMAGVDNYWVKQNIMGQEIVTYYEKKMVDGEPVFVSEEMGDAEGDEIGEMYAEFAKYAKRAKYQGEETVDGEKTYALFIDDFSGMEMGQDEEFTPKKGTFYLDADDYTLRKMTMEGVASEGGEREQPVTIEAYFKDYREVKGMLHPFLTTVRMEGVTAGMSEEEMQEARESLEELKTQMEQMPDAQREMMENMMKDQLEQLEQIVNSGTMEMTLEVTELHVNEGKPEGQ